MQKLSEYQNRIKELQSVETNLRSQVSLYTDKYNEFQTALSKSNEIFNGFNKEMEKVSLFKNNFFLLKNINIYYFYNKIFR